MACSMGGCMDMLLKPKRTYSTHKRFSKVIIGVINMYVEITQE